MKKMHYVLMLMGLALFSTTTTFAKSEASLRAEGGISGYGGAILYHVHPTVNLVLGYNGGGISWKNQLSILGAQTDLKVENDVSYFNINYYPWGKSDNPWLSALYTSIGMGYVDNKYNLHRNFRLGEKRPGILNNSFFPKNKEVDVRGYVDFSNGISPYFGLGFSPQLNEHWGVFTEVGLYYVGEATAHVTHINKHKLPGFVPVNFTTFKLGNHNFVAWSPVAKTGVTYRF